MNLDARFDSRPRVKSKLNILPSNPEVKEEGKPLGRFPSWLHRKLPKGFGLAATEEAVKSERLFTVCEEAKCPNRMECWALGTATFLAMGKACTRSCGFCSVEHQSLPPPLEDDEPKRIADSVSKLKLKHVVITMVARDDLSDGGGEHLVEIVKAVRNKNPHVSIELLTSDFAGNREALKKVVDVKPDVFNHNIETVRRLTPRVRHKATYERTLSVLQYAAHQGLKVKSGLMVGLGETDEEVQETLTDLRAVGCEIITIGQYLQPNAKKLLVKEFIPPERYKAWENFGKSIGFQAVFAGPFVRSSYHAGEIYGQ